MNQTAKSKVSRITIGRLYNLGNYEHVRYELSVDVPDGASATAAFGQMVRLLRAVNPKPPCTSHDLKNALEVLMKSSDHLRDYEKDNLDYYKKLVANHAEWRARREKAVALFDAIGGTTDAVDSKDTWEEDFDFCD